MKNIAIISLLFLTGCFRSEPITSINDSAREPFIVYFPCDLFNSSNEWVYCDPIEVDFASFGQIGIIEMNFNLRNQKGGESVVLAEIYNLTTSLPVPYSQVQSEIDYFLHTRVSADLAESLKGGKYRLTIRFRSSLADHTSYMSDNSYLAIY